VYRAESRREGRSHALGRLRAFFPFSFFPFLSFFFPFCFFSPFPFFFLSPLSSPFLLFLFPPFFPLFFFFFFFFFSFFLLSLPLFFPFFFASFFSPPFPFFLFSSSSPLSPPLFFFSSFFLSPFFSPCLFSFTPCSKFLVVVVSPHCVWVVRTGLAVDFGFAGPTANNQHRVPLCRRLVDHWWQCLVDSPMESSLEINHIVMMYPYPRRTKGSGKTKKNKNFDRFVGSGGA